MEIPWTCCVLMSRKYVNHRLAATFAADYIRTKSSFWLADTSDEIEFVCLRLRFKWRFYASLIVSFAGRPRERIFGLENRSKFGPVL